MWLAIAAKSTLANEVKTVGSSSTSSSTRLGGELEEVRMILVFHLVLWSFFRLYIIYIYIIDVCVFVNICFCELVSLM